MIDYETLKSRVFPSVTQSYTARDAMIYALGLNIGHDPLDPVDLEFVAGDPPKVVPMMAMTLVRPRPWIQDPSTGIDYRRMVLGEVSLKLHGTLPPEATLRGEHRVVRITDKGEGRGALMTINRSLFDAGSDRLLAEFEQVNFCRANGGFAKDGRHDPPAPRPSWEVGTRAPDIVVPMPTSPHQALIYRLSGDLNPLHSDPEIARKAGFERPILHGLSTMGMTGHALFRAVGLPQGRSIREIHGRLSAPVTPGDQLRLEIWTEAEDVFFHVLGPDDRAVVTNGHAKFQ